MISEQLANALNTQMNNEFAAAQTYLSMASYCEYRNYSGFAHYYLQQVEEERAHAMKIYTYLHDRGIRAIITETPAPATSFDNLVHTFEVALEQEKEVTKSFYKIMDMAWEEKEHATISFLNWFLDEQVEEEATFDKHIEYLKRIREDKNALFIYEKELSARSFADE
ncbi:ferritin [Sporosarcina sp. PTS2304]|uniref:ferritin n=1 Tax=Sporosarcina sp. PTS2304 TaxID=2283194 RepID=UPI000E0D4441|nr:ferritin [Sporosarcina sp. PTS2304]AXH99610.1 ferritin [Sporosarcina sp. PTS2304]